jgi:hypothetical protein
MGIFYIIIDFLKKYKFNEKTSVLESNVKLESRDSHSLVIIGN